MRIDLHIDRLVLDGVPLDRRHAAALEAAVVAELTGSLGAVAGWRSGRVRVVTTAAVTLGAPVHPETAGAAIARALRDGLAASRAD